jgi:hypothetical protein
MKGFYYLNRGKRLLFQKARPRGAVREWEFDDEVTTVSVLWQIAIEALGLGTPREEILSFLDKWKVSENSGIEFAKRCGIIVGQTETGSYVASVATSKVGGSLKFGSGPTVVEALANLASPGLYVTSQKGLRSAMKGEAHEGTPSKR